MGTGNDGVTIAMAQIYGLAGDRSGNLVRIENAIREAKEKQAEIIVFPETSLFGWVNPEAHRRASPIPGKDSRLLGQLAKKYDLFICIGLAEKADDQLFDTAILIDPNGTIILKHRKINILTSLMTPPYKKGDEVKVVDTKYGRIGMLICADSFEEELLSRMRAQQPDLLLIPYGWAAEEEEWPVHGQELKKVVENAAQKVNCPVVGPNIVGQIAHGPWTGQTFGGLSVAVDNRSDTLIIGKDRERDIIVFTLDIPGLRPN